MSRRFDSATFHKVAQRCYCNKKKQINNLFRLNTLEISFIFIFASLSVVRYGGKTGVKIRKRVPELTGAERNKESLLTLVSLSDHHPQAQRNDNIGLSAGSSPATPTIGVWRSW